MYLRTTKRRNKDGSEVVYYQLAETVYIKEKRQPQAHVVHTFGRADAVDLEALRRLAGSIERVCGAPDVEQLRGALEFQETFGLGVIHVVEALWEQLGIGPILRRHMGKEKRKLPYDRLLLALAANRLDEPASKLSCFEHWLPARAWFPEAAQWKAEQLYWALDFLLTHIAAIEEELFQRVANLFNADVDLIFYDTTTLYFETDEEDEGEDALRRRGHNKEGRDGNPQVVVGLAVTREGLPVKSWVFPGNTGDVTTIARIREELRGWRLNRAVLVGDAGMFSADNQALLSKGLGRYILAVPMRRIKEVQEQVLTRPGRYKPVRENLEVKEILVGDGERRQRYILCRNLDEAARQVAHRERILALLEAELESLAVAKEDHPKRACELLASKRFGRYLKEGRNDRLVLDRAKVDQEARMDGKYVLTTNDDTLSAEDVALGYMGAMIIEGCFRRMKTTGLQARPIFHWAPSRIEAHVKLCVLALLIQRAAEIRTGETWRNLHRHLETLKAIRYRQSGKTIVQRTRISPELKETLARLTVPAPEKVLRIED
jgi:transposase